MSKYTPKRTHTGHITVPAELLNNAMKRSVNNQLRKLGVKKMPQRLEKGDYVELTEDADFSPHAYVRRGARGRVVSIYPERGSADIELDHTYPGLEDNMIWTNHLEPLALKHVRRQPTLLRLVTVAFVTSFITYGGITWAVAEGCAPAFYLSQLLGYATYTH